MKSILKIMMVVLIFAFTPLVHAGTASKIAPDNSSPELQRIKSLEGRWVTVTSMFSKKNQRMYTEYEVTAGGSAVLERIFPGTPHEMVSVYYDDDNGKLTMTHYCIMRNRSTLKLSNSTKDSITLHLEKVSGPKFPKDKGMGDLKITFIDKNHITGTCGINAKGKNAKKPMTMEYTRVK